MRILVAAERLGPGGGMERYLDVVLPALVARGARVHVVARRIEELPPGITAEVVDWSDEHDAPAAAARSLVDGALRSFAPDLAVAENVMDAGIVEALRAAPRFAYRLHDHRPFCPNGDRVYPRGRTTCTTPLGVGCAVHALVSGCAYGPKPRTLRLIRERCRLRDAIDAADIVFVSSAYLADRAIESGVVHPALITVAPPLADAAFCAAPTFGRARIVIFIGRIVPQKGLDSLVRAVARIDRARRPAVHAFGTGPASSDVRALAARLDVDVQMPGFASPVDLRSALDEAAFLALPSRWAEPFGYAGIEAFARGRTVAAYTGGGIGEWLRPGENGCSVASGDEDAFAGSIARLLDDAPERARLAAHARMTAERFRLRPAIDHFLCAAYG